MHGGKGDEIKERKGKGGKERLIKDYLIFAWIMRISGPIIGVWGQNGGRGGAILTLNSLIFVLGVLMSVPVLVKIDQ